MAYYAHSREGRPETEWQPLREHLKAVAEKARAFALEARPGDEAFGQAAFWAGMMLDLGNLREPVDYGRIENE